MTWHSVRTAFAYVLVGVTAVSLGVYVTSMVVPFGLGQNQKETLPLPPPPKIPSPTTQTPEVPVNPPQAPQTVDPNVTKLPPPPQSSEDPTDPPAPNLVESPDPSGGLDAEKMEDTITSFLQPFIYQSDNRRDPFEPFQEVRPVETELVTGPLLPLQRFDINNIKLVGVIWDVQSPKAMFVDPNKNVHVLAKDDRIGRNNGYIAVIREGEVVVVESVKVRGENTYTTRVLKVSR